MKSNHILTLDTMKLSKFKHLSNRANRTDLNTSSSRRTALELFDYFCVFFCKERFTVTKSN